MPERAYRAIVFAALALVLGMTLYQRWEPYSFLRDDGSFYATITRGIVTDLSLDQERWQPASWYSGKHVGYRNMDMAWSNVSIGADGTWYPKHSFLMPVAAAPFYVLFGNVGFLIFNALCVLLMLWAAYLIAVRYAPPPAAVAVVILAALGPKVLDHTYHFSLDVFSAMLTALGFAALLARRSVAAGLLFGFAIWTRFTLAILIVPVGIAMIWRLYDRRDWLRLVAAGALPLLGAAIANTLMFGAPWHTSYDSVLTVVNGVPTVQSVRKLFDLPASQGWKNMIEHDWLGMIKTQPVALVSLVGLVPLARKRPLLSASMALAVAGFVLFFLNYRHFSSRFFFAWHLVLLTPLAVLLTDLALAGRWAGGSLARLLRPADPAVRRRVVQGLLVLGGLALAALVVARGVSAGGPWRAAEHVADAHLTRNGQACDYYNMRHLKWECSRHDRHGWQLVGGALGDDCKFQGEPGPGVFMHAPKKGVRKVLRWDDLPRGPVTLRYGMPDRGKKGEVCAEVRFGDAAPVQLCASEPGVLLERRLEPPAAGPTSLSVSVRPEQAGFRAFCFDAEIPRG